ncbi:MAG TPA: MFS transporter [Ktedonobacterales bacterium]|nr:MFS transporter [Ktedonobacterales bacterium]
MVTEAVSGIQRALPRRSMGGLIAISIFWFALNFHWAALLTILIPSQVIGLLFREAPAGSLASQSAWVSGHEGLTLAIVIAPGLVVALLSNPFFGLLSDRTPLGRLGKRRPYILGGTVLNVVGLAVMALAPTTFTVGGSGNPLAPSLLLMMVGLMVTQLGNNAAAAPFHAYLPDFVPEHQRGTASGIMGLALLLGQIGGAITPSIVGFNSKQLLAGGQSFSTYNAGIVSAYAIVAVVMVLMAVLTAATVREGRWAGSAATTTPSPMGPMLRALGFTVLAVVVLVVGFLALLPARIGLALNDTSLSALQIIGVVVAGLGAVWAFDFRPRRAPDFSWVVLTRMLVMMGVDIVQTFLLLYMQDVAHAPSPQTATTIFIIILTLTAALSTIFAGWGSDRFGRKRMVYISGSFMAAVGAAFVIAPYVVPAGVLTVAFAASAVFGLGYGAYLAVDWALVADVLPSDATFARDMGVWNIALTVPQVLAAVFGGWMLALGVALGAKSLGYTFLFVAFVVFCVLGTVTVRYIRGVAR